MLTSVAWSRLAVPTIALTIQGATHAVVEVALLWIEMMAARVMVSVLMNEGLYSAGKVALWQKQE